MKSAGFSLVESMVVVTMVSILSIMSLQAIPALRAHQELVTDTETIRALLLDAKQRALNQVRPEDCLSGFAVTDSARAGCSDVGVALRQGEIIQFANSHETGGSGPKYDTNDYVIVRSKAASKIKFGSPTSLLFLGNPPATILYKDGAEIAAGDFSTKIILTASNGRERTITVYSSGTIDVQ